MKKRFAKVMCIVLAAGFLVAGCGSKGENETENKKEENTSENVTATSAQFGFITGSGGLGDKNMNDAAYGGLKTLEAEGVKLNAVEPEESSDYTNLQSLFAETGEYKAIFCITYEQTDSLVKVSEQFPEQRFILVDSEVEADNVTNVLFRPEETGFQLGVLAGILEKENALSLLNDEQRVGFIGGQDNPIINQFAAGYKAGVLLVNPEATVDISYVGSYSDPSKATEIANGLYENGCDIVFACAGGSGLGVFSAAEKMNGYAFGIEVNQNDNAPDNVIASGLRLWDVVMSDIGRKVIAEEIEGGTLTYGLTEKALEIGYEKSNVEVSDAVKSEVDTYMEKVISGEYKLPTTLDNVNGFLSDNK